jgi:molybdopterin molybdotransferase
METPGLDSLIGVGQAIELIDAVSVTPRSTLKPLRQALGLRLAEAVMADRDYPPFDKSQMDGYAVRQADVPAEGSAPAALKVVGEVAAGQWSDRTLEPGQTVAIMTGAPLPPGADGVVPIEQVRPGPAADQILISSGDWRRMVSWRGADGKKGQTVLQAGQLIGPAQMAVAAMVGTGMLRVWDRPRVAILSTGDELVEIGHPPSPWQIRNSNNSMLYGLLHQMNADVVDLGISPDRPDDLRSVLRDGLMHDALLVSGGMSMGKYDFVPKILQELGVRLRITKLRIKPGKPFVFGIGPRGDIPPEVDEQAYAEIARAPRPPLGSAGSCYVFGLPGNPVSAFVCTVRFAWRLLARLGGGPVIEPWRDGILQQDLPANGPREFYLPVRMEGEKVYPLNWRGSADLFTLAGAQGLLVRPENAPAIAAGQPVRVLHLAGS